MIVWLTGLSSAGKSTLAEGLSAALSPVFETCIIDGDVLRERTNNKDFSAEGRRRNVLNAGRIAKSQSESGCVAIVALVSPYRKERAIVRRMTPPGFFVEVFVKCSVSACAARDKKDLYQRAFSGEIHNLTGVNDPYEEPVDPEIVIDTERLSIIESQAALFRAVFLRLESGGFTRSEVCSYGKGMG